ncbi:MAG: DUF4935 domain-containing protein [Pontiellaceae bacterium]|nr:DUF4935 domain-containing protein [Pontiellaceae bacterium]
MDMPEHVFLDTNIYEQKLFNFSGKSFVRLLEHCREDTVDLLLPHPIELEIRRHIQEICKAKIDGMNKHLVKNRILMFYKPIQDALVERELNAQLFIDDIISKLDAFLAESKAVRLDYSNVDIGEVMGQYDGNVPPFGEGDKRKEFSDAFAMEILRHHPSEQIAVISTDQDIEKTCGGVGKFLYFKSLEEYLAYVQKARSKHYDAVLELLRVNEQTINDALSHEFLNRGFHVEEDDGDGEFCDIEINSVEYHETDIIDLDYDQVTFTFNIVLAFSGTAIYNNYDTAFKDDDTKDWIAWEKKKIQVEEEVDCSGDCVISYDLKNGDIRVITLSLDLGDLVIQAEPIEYF